MARQHGGHVEFGERGAAVLDVVRGMISMPSSSAAVFMRPWVSTTAATRSVPRSSRRCASPSIAYVLPTPGAAPDRCGVLRVCEGVDGAHTTIIHPQR
ncbi:hypothetical protein BZL30_2735 [Mycobacterium kansasii]|uniref:Uncharacterized protein n=1 Tax=Mycobacterium kansasii TaxID=1768 RepID=A0A1V3XL57_MYCKA|nr:hypothetical protein BZL30_2735 [Mycobacterium kansasii]